MGKTLCGVASSHAPQILLRTPAEDMAQLDRFYRALEEARKKLYDNKPDILLVVSNDHFDSFFLDNYPAIALYVGDKCEGELGGRLYNYKVHEEFSKELIFDLVDSDFDVSLSEDIKELGHHQIVPLNWLVPRGDIPLALLYVNAFIPPQPKASRCLSLGQKIREFVKASKYDVGVLATGALSHYTGTPSYGKVDVAFDKKLLDLLKAGEGGRLAELTPEILDDTGNNELRNWITMLGILGDVKGEVLFYERSWHIGYSVIYFEGEGNA